MCVCTGDDKPVYSGPEIMSRMELVTAVRSMQETMREMEKRYATSKPHLCAHALPVATHTSHTLQPACAWG